MILTKEQQKLLLTTTGPIVKEQFDYITEGCDIWGCVLPHDLPCQIKDDYERFVYGLEDYWYWDGDDMYAHPIYDKCDGYLSCICLKILSLTYYDDTDKFNDALRCFVLGRELTAKNHDSYELMPCAYCGEHAVLDFKLGATAYCPNGNFMTRAMYKSCHANHVENEYSARAAEDWNIMQLRARNK
jgi:hypothetical protein